VQDHTKSTAGSWGVESAARAAPFLELAGQIEQSTIALVSTAIDLPGLHSTLHGASGFSGVQAVLESAPGGDRLDLGKTPLDVP
jgi:hypothetical protein